MQPRFRVKALGLALLVGATLALASPGARADDKSDVAAALKGTSTEKIPQDAAFYYSALRNKDQLDRLFKSKAWKALKKTPVYGFAVAALKDQLTNVGVPEGVVERLLSDKKQDKDDKPSDEEQFAHLMLDSLRDEIFIYGGKGFSDLFALLAKAQSAQNAVAFGGFAEGKFDDPQLTKAGTKAFLTEVQKGREAIKVPDLIIGFKTKDGKKFKDHVGRYEKVLQGLFDKEEKLKGKVKRDGDMLRIEVDGSAIPWDDLPWDEDYGKKEDYQKLFDHLKKLTLVLSAGVKDGYLLFAVTSTVKDLDKFGGKGKALVEREEFAPIGKYAKEKLTSVGYVSKEFAAGASGYGGFEFDDLGKGLKGIVEKHVKKAEHKKGLNKDIDDLLAELKKWNTEPGATLDFSFMTSSGYEGFDYNYGKHDHLKGVRTNLFEHVGADPIWATAFGFKVDGSVYSALSKLTKSFYAHGEAIFLDSDVPQDAKDEFSKRTKAVLPHLKTLDDTITKTLIPSLKSTSGMGLVLDGKWTSKQWHKEMPESKKALPMLQPAVLLTVNDPEKFVDAARSFRTIFNDIYKVLREFNQNEVPEFELKAPTKTKGKKLPLYTWPAFKDSGVDEQVELTAGVEKGIGTLAFSRDHAERILTSTKLKLKDGPLVAHDKGLISGTLLNFPQLGDVVIAWANAAPDLVPPDAPEQAKMQVANVAKQVVDVVKILKCFREYQSATYLDGAKLTTHTRSVFKDLEAEAEPK